MNLKNIIIEPCFCNNKDCPSFECSQNYINNNLIDCYVCNIKIDKILKKKHYGSIFHRKNLKNIIKQKKLNTLKCLTIKNELIEISEESD